jgi:hypothetical protein
MTTSAPTAASSVRDRRADPLRAAGDDRDLAFERRHCKGEKDVGTRIRCVAWMSG